MNQKGRVIANFKPETKEEIPINIGDEVEIKEVFPDGWTKVKCKNLEGLVPSNYFVTYIEEEKEQDKELEKDHKSSSYFKQMLSPRNWKKMEFPKFEKPKDTKEEIEKLKKLHEKEFENLKKEHLEEIYLIQKMYGNHKFDELQNENLKEKEKVKELKIKYKEIVEEYELLEEKYEQLKKVKKGLMLKNNDLLDVNDELYEKIDKLKINENKLKDENQELKDKNSRLKEDVKFYREELEIMEKRESDLLKKLSKLQN